MMPIQCSIHALARVGCCASWFHFLHFFFLGFSFPNDSFADCKAKVKLNLVPTPIAPKQTLSFVMWKPSSPNPPKAKEQSDSYSQVASNDSKQHTWRSESLHHLFQRIFTHLEIPIERSLAVHRTLILASSKSYVWAICLPIITYTLDTD